MENSLDLTKVLLLNRVKLSLLYISQLHLIILIPFVDFTGKIYFQLTDVNGRLLYSKKLDLTSVINILPEFILASGI